MNAVDFHTAIAAQFDSKYETSAAFRERFRVWTDLFDRYVGATDTVMDMGCGSGVFSRYLARMGCTVTAIDGSEAMISLCQQYESSANVHYVLDFLPLEDVTCYGPQHVIIASSLLEYIPDVTPVLHHANTLLTPGGLLIASIPNRLSLYRRAERVVFALTGRPRYFAHVQTVLTETAFTRQLSDMGFQHLETVFYATNDPVSKFLKRVLPDRYVTNLFVAVYQKR
ncbi:MAG: methyltransferase domain-containing protein [Bacteroidetes bacterium]|nr:methyltransferase domain-containing protein [Fibrella sp.]